MNNLQIILLFPTIFVTIYEMWQMLRLHAFITVNGYLTIGVSLYIALIVCIAIQGCFVLSLTGNLSYG